MTQFIAELIGKMVIVPVVREGYHFILNERVETMSVGGILGRKGKNDWDLFGCVSLYSRPNEI